MPVEHLDLGGAERDDLKPTLYKKVIQSKEAVARNKLNSKASSEHSW